VGTPISETHGAIDQDATVQAHNPNGDTSTTIDMVAEREAHLPGGRGVSRSVARLERRVLIPLVMGSLLGALAALYLVAGLAAVAVGAALLVVYYVIGWGPEIGAAILRGRERRRIERDVRAAIDARRPTGSGVDMTSSGRSTHA
jgi:hypothetical protein